MLAGQAAGLSADHTEHVLTEHDHQKDWCSGRFYCKTCQKWITAEPCQVATSALSVRRSQGGR
jgi:hypothetical protein